MVKIKGSYVRTRNPLLFIDRYKKRKIIISGYSLWCGKNVFKIKRPNGYEILYSYLTMFIMGYCGIQSTI